MSNNISDLMNNFSKLLTKKIDEILPKNSLSHNKLDVLYSAMRYTTLAKAKHLRPFLAFLTSQIFNVEIVRIIPVCVAIEFIHVYSLIHDDLPAIDNDNMRRGQPSCHKKFNEAIAILTGNTLLTLAFELLSQLNEDSNICCKIIKTLAESSGYKGMIGGQVLDITQTDNTANTIKTIHIMKTAKLFSSSCSIGGILGNATDKEIKLLVNYGKNIGCAFQIKDDINDVSQDNTKNNLVNIIGMPQAKKYMSMLFDESTNCLSYFSEQASTLHSFTKFLRDEL